MKHISVTKKLWLGVASIVIGAVIIIGHAGYNSAAHQKKFNQQDSLLSQRLDQASQWGALSQVNIVRTQAALASSDPQDGAELARQITQTDQNIQALQQMLQASSASSQEQTDLQQLAQLRQAMQTQSTHAQSFKDRGQTDEAREAARSSFRAAADAYTQALNQYVHQQAQNLAQMRADMGAARQGVVRTAAINMVFLLLGIAVGAYLLIGNIRRSMQEANHIAERIAEGDLRPRSHEERRDEFGQLLQSLQRMSLSLSSMMNDVRQSGDAISLASSEIASGNQDLSQRTEITSSHLQQAAAAIMQLTHTLKDTASSAQQAAGLAQQASGIAQRGGTVVHEVVETMTDIHSRSQKIADIIGVIDGIAFQTNILALNAAVEAARAGEQGRGFAVVAAEVRTLAQRSAQAAKEIKQLIQDSVSRMADGARLVQDAGTTMTEVVQSIHRVTEVMQTINTNAAEQRDGVAQVNEAVGSLDQMTQQNAALVEQSAAAAHSLREQSEHLRELVQRFKVAPSAAEAAALTHSLVPATAPLTMARPISHEHKMESMREHHPKIAALVD
ncbi:methyl-accepting chemotaxis protein [Comamonas sp.]|uniref:methyl-accepting chemotaxis protein n=1 Tax=Comamonas sp. TaxID=34028 RepID=UPI002590D356|nr:methyl-accepting chemotaxis protein [Comamonas sp.]